MNRRLLFAQALGFTGFRWLLANLRPWSGLVVLNYHRVGDGRGSLLDRDLWSTTPEAFADQVQYCKAHFDVIRAEELADLPSRRKGQYVLFTFDDGYLDNHTAVFPILKKHGVTATFFIATGFIDQRRLAWWDEVAWMVRTSGKDRIHLPGWLPDPVLFDEPDCQQAIQVLQQAYKNMASDRTAAYLDALGEALGTGRSGLEEGGKMWMTWDMIREMRRAGMTIGGHTVSHPILAQMGPEQQWHEISDCGRRLQEELREPMHFFSYPDGRRQRFNDDTRACLRRAGVRFAFSYYGGWQSLLGWDSYDMRRVGVEDYITSSWFRAIVELPGVFARTEDEHVPVHAEPGA
jgi:peptidoglycan/xylan/chitin deacetylase (PgdA/CDA1 family)